MKKYEPIQVGEEIKPGIEYLGDDDKWHVLVKSTFYMWNPARKKPFLRRKRMRFMRRKVK